MRCTNLPRSVKLALATLATATLGLSWADAVETFQWVTTSGADLTAAFTITDEAYARGVVSDSRYPPNPVHDMYRIEVDISNQFAEYVHGPVWWQRDGDILTTSINADLYSLFGSISMDGQVIEMSSFVATYGTATISPEFFNMSGSGNSLSVQYGNGNIGAGISETRTSSGYWSRVPDGGATLALLVFALAALGGFTRNQLRATF
jgi:hypothetical protein